MKALLLTEYKKMSYVDVADPVCGPEDVLIQVRACGICGSDIHGYDGSTGRRIPPLVMGHEAAGVITGVGAQVKGFAPGDRVTFDSTVFCGECVHCKRGDVNLCDNRQVLGVSCGDYRRHGAFAEYMAMPASNLWPIPDQIPSELAAFFDPYGNAAHCALEFDVIGEDVLITGAGPIGIIAAGICKHIGARNVVVTDVNDYRLKLAADMGATRVVNVSKQSLKDVMAELQMEGFDVGLEMSGVPQAFNDMLDCMYHGGKVALLGILPKGAGIDWDRIIFKGLTVQGIYGRKMYETWYKMTQMVLTGFPLQKVLTHQVHIDDFQKGFDLMEAGVCGKVVCSW